MTGSTRVRRFRLSTIWPAFVPALFDQHSTAGAPLTQLAGVESYSSYFANVRDGKIDVHSPPWSDNVEHRFWREYVTQSEDAVRQTVPTRDASRFLVPLHQKLEAPVLYPWKLSAHAFLYPFGPSLLLHAEFPHPDQPQEDASGLSLEELVERCYDLRNGGAAEDPDFWYTFAEKAITALARAYGATGSDADVGHPLTVATFLQVELDRLDDLDRDRVLTALTVWPDRSVWRSAQPGPVSPVMLSPSKAIQGRLIHAAGRGRALWFPDGFQSGSLSEMHRRLAFITMQTEMLTRFLYRTSERMSDLPPEWSDWSQPAARVIGLLYGGRIVAMDSTSPRVQIDSSGVIDHINAVRLYWGRPKLHSP